MQLTPGLRTALRIVWVLLLLAVVIGSLLPASSPAMKMLGRLHISDKVLHFAGYALLALLPAIHERLRAVAGATFGLVALGVLIEFTQLEAGWGRMFELRDIAANSLGVGVGLVAGLFMRPDARGTFGDTPHTRI